MEIKNPLDLNIGTKVRVARTCTVEYDADKVKRLFFEDAGVEAFVTGVVRKATGMYVSGSSHQSLDGYVEPDPAYLDIDKFHVLYECRPAINKKPFLVHPDDIEVIK